MKLALLRAAMRRCTSVLIYQPAEVRRLPRGAPLRQVQQVAVSPPLVLPAEPPPSASPCPFSRSTSGFSAAELRLVHSPAQCRRTRSFACRPALPHPAAEQKSPSLPCRNSPTLKCPIMCAIFLANCDYLYRR